MCPCNNCYPQNDLLYDPTQSSTFSKISCQSSYCSSDTMQNICFDCSHDNGGQFMKIDGLLGLGRGALLIISQTAQFYGKVFSYCLPSNSNVVRYLALGSSATGVQYTPMLTNPKPAIPILPKACCHFYWG
ncbi:Aspartic proteinase nepenthesin-2 [Dendrobium catenatum]|uniref:Aspartic proteinase nepenthesin-2 n=1 Tax=Dendrobium catenatum TaxID=906689 RepID=A0A2I0XCU6_9ASPA|nr:Aspartic proteinase nepenthesin-2 [Dendrobium catenatum]